MELYPHQKEALRKMKNGCILCGDVGSGKSLTSLAYYHRLYGGTIDTGYSRMNNPPDIYIITTARKRDEFEWESELCVFELSTHEELNAYSNRVVVDSWNNIKKYKDVHGAFFIFDEQRVIGKGSWVKTFLNLTRKNKWILLSATPGDKWEDYIPVFIANGFYRNRSEFEREHVVFNPYLKYRSVQRYLSTGRLIRFRKDILVEMDFKRHTIAHHEDVMVEYDRSLYKSTNKLRWDPYKDAPIKNASALCYILRKLLNSDDSRQLAVLELYEKHPKLIIFYNFDYELEILKSIFSACGANVAEWNGHQHQPIPDKKSWVYLVQYTAGAEGWNCIKTDTIVFFSQNYSYRILKQSTGRIDRLNTPYIDLYYYHLRCTAPLDLAIHRALREKRNFNESKFVGS